MIILAIETSCDDTCIALIKVIGKKYPRFKILSNVVSSQEKIHKKFGGVYPIMAKREHQKNLVPVLRQALKKNKMLKKVQNLKFHKGETGKTQSYDLKFKVLKEILNKEKVVFDGLKHFLTKYQKPKIDLIAVTIGPGLGLCLWQGVNFARALSFFWRKSVVPVNHIEGHIFANWLAPIGLKSKIKYQISKIIKFPAICLVISGGHTQLILMKDFGKYEIIGETRDDAAGECFDKTARILGLGYPGGPAIAAEAAKLQITNYKLQIRLPRPMKYQKNYDFSFSGLKTAVLYQVKSAKRKAKSEKFIQAMSVEIQRAIVDVLIYKTLKATKDFRAKTIILGGGVAANNELRKQFILNLKSKILNFNFLVPSKNLCTDNAAMIGAAAYYHWRKQKSKFWENIEAKTNLRIN